LVKRKIAACFYSLGGSSSLQLHALAVASTFVLFLCEIRDSHLTHCAKIVNKYLNLLQLFMENRFFLAHSVETKIIKGVVPRSQPILITIVI